MKQVGSAAADWLATGEKLAAEREERIRATAGGRDVHTVVAGQYGADVAKLFPGDFTFDDYIRTTTDAALDEARTRLDLCRKCPTYGGACASEYEQNRGKAPCWDRDNGLRLDWCAKWRGYIVREKLGLVGVGQVLLDARFETFNAAHALQEKARTKCEKYATEFQRGTTTRNLLICGGALGVGKTHLAVSVLASVLARHKIRHAMFAYVPEFFDRVRRSFDEPELRGLVDRASRVDLLVLDDLGAERTTDWVREQMNLIANARWSNGRPVIVTTNEGPDEVAATLGPRAASRLLGNALGVEVDGEDQRWLKRR